ncbi:hypothetical protein [Streptomyces sp. A012304]|uniref:hypothetical protein n=1 Tax=Streptomyces sp. A012304 TaxID=375446 RepID=UPI002230224F|nr:hypothetical protein [Streptomyces sp. A012304]GKQ38900.1 hypothetical protein ALMP_54290 [Streptomyces sp. A012304]
MSTSYDPLREPDAEPQFPASLDGELRLAREYLSQVAGTNIHDHTAMVKAAVGLDHRLRALIAALDAKRGEHR